MEAIILSTENFWFLLALIPLFNVLVFIICSGNEKTGIKLIRAKDNKEIDSEETAVLLIAIAMVIPIFICCCWYTMKWTNSNIIDQPENFLLNSGLHIFGFLISLAVSFIATFATWVIFLLFSLLNFDLLDWQEKSKLVRKNNKFLLANLALLAAIIFSLIICLTLQPINNFLIILLASALPAIFLYSQETFFCIKNLSEKTA